MDKQNILELTGRLILATSKQQFDEIYLIITNCMTCGQLFILATKNAELPKLR